MRIWIKDPLAILATGAARGLVVEGTRIVELVAAGASPSAPVDATFDASRHVVLPGLVNAHHHFYQTLTRAHPAAINRELFDWLTALYPIWARLKPGHLRLAARLALTELMLSGCTTAADHHYLYPGGPRERRRHRGRGGAGARHPHDGDARLDELEPEGRRPAARHRRAGRARRSWPTASAC